MVLVIGVLGAWGKGKTLTLTMLQELAKYYPNVIGLDKPCIIVSNYMSKFADYVIAINPQNKEVYNQYTKQSIQVLDLEQFLSKPPDENDYFLFLDDVYSWLASWYFSSNFNNMALRLLASGRKKNINIALSSTRWKDIDPRLRANHTHLIFPTYIPEKKVCKIEINLIGVHDLIPLKTLYFNAERYFNAYDTKEIIAPVYPTKSKIKTVVRTNGHIITQTEQALQDNNNKIDDKIVLENRKPDGYEALAKGIIIQQQIADEYKKQGYIVECNFGDKEPDIILYADENKTKPIKVVSVKSFYLVPSNQRWTATPLPSSSSFSGGVVRRQGFATTRMVYRRDLAPEISFALQYNVPLELVIVNQRNMKRQVIVLEGEKLRGFQSIASSQELNKDEDTEKEKEKEKEENENEEENEGCNKGEGKGKGVVGLG
ncbi:MAG: hypothetical protein H5T50_03845 [Nitrososphaeria archaeon]|nr:hypothetical protein [Nitrososphaeria archaeon]